MEAQIEQLKVGEQNAMPEVRPGIAGMRMLFENQLRACRTPPVDAGRVGKVRSSRANIERRAGMARSSDNEEEVRP